MDTDADVKSSRMAGFAGALMLLMAICIVGFLRIMMPDDQLYFPGWISVPGFIFPFIISGALSSYLAPGGEAGKAFRRGVTAGGVTALIMFPLWFLCVVVISYLGMTWSDLIVMVMLLIAIIVAMAVGMIISAFSSMTYVFLTRHITIKAG